MPDVSQLAAIASRYATRMADAMIAACVRRAIETGEELRIQERAAVARRGRRPTEDVDWERMVEGNRASDATWRKS